mmetsp:Transcript_8409/g.25268  ORF Transcript_8409/g.25268 Transcript_8409/m.25268 type:complete len:332 (+) Transcript_8409:227-1222(+)
MGRISQMITSTQFYFYGRSRFTQTGWQKASKAYAEDLEAYDLTGKVYAVTGANSGVGRTTAEYLARRGARVFMVCRSAERAEKARAEMLEGVTGGSLDVLVGDVSLASSVRDVAAALRKETASLDGLVCNAGVLLNDKTLTPEGVETTFAAHLAFGCALLTRELLPLLRATPGSRVVYTSSGGMYNSKFPGVAACVDPEAYDGQFAYVYAKRGQVLLAEHYAKAEPKVAFVSSHPGWVRTAAVEAAYGSSAKYLEPMRTPWEGAEGQCWLCAVAREKLEPGAFYLDRAPRRKHLAGPFFTDGSATKNTADEVAAMVADLNALADAKLAAAA